MPTRHELDAIAWRTIKAKPRLKLAESRGSRPMNYRELEQRLQQGQDWDLIWSDFLHAFYDHKDPSFFAYPPPPSLSPGWQALLAGAAEWLSAEFGLPKPSWTDDPRYFLPEVWDLMGEGDMPMALPDITARTLERSPEAFRKRNVAFEGRGLIAI